MAVTGLLSGFNKSNQHGQPITKPTLLQQIRILFILPIYYLSRLFNFPFQLRLIFDGKRTEFDGIDDSRFTDEKEMESMLHRIGGAGLRSTGSEAHNGVISWLEDELAAISGLKIQSEDIELFGWQPKQSLYETGRLTVVNEAGEEEEAVPIAGIVPYSLPVDAQTGSLMYLPPGVSLSSHDLACKIILREFPLEGIPYALAMLPSYYKTADLNSDICGIYERPGLADQPIHEDLLQAGKGGAAGIIFIFNIPRMQVKSYWEPHKGCHYQVPAAYVGIDEGLILKERAIQGFRATISINAATGPLMTRNLTAILPGQTEERIIYITHTDGNTYVQENGPAALLALAKYFASLPISSRRRTIEFAFNAGHLHISREGSLRHARQLKESFDHNNLVLTIPVEHLGTREIEAFPREDDRPGRTLKFTPRGEMMFWCTGPSVPVVKAVKKAVERRKLDRILVSRGTSLPNFKSVPTFTSFGGIGTYYHNFLLPTTSLISGPWSLWAPEFAIEAISIQRLRQQTLALGDIYLSLERIPKSAILEGYTNYHTGSWKPVLTEEPPERASDYTGPTLGAVKY